MTSRLEPSLAPHQVARTGQSRDRAATTMSSVDELLGISLRLLGRQHEAEDVVSFHFQPERPLSYRAGQYLRYTLPHLAADDRGESRYFTIASAPAEPSIMLTTRLPERGSSFKQALARLEPGMPVWADEPAGEFVYTRPPTGQPAVFIAGGIGITPFRSILVDLAAAPAPTGADITLLYANRTPDIAFKPLLDDLAHTLPGFKVVYVVSDPDAGWRGATGRIDAGVIARHVPDLLMARYFVSGPRSMVKAMSQALAQLGVEREQIKRDSFPGYD